MQVCKMNQNMSSVQISNFQHVKLTKMKMTMMKFVIS